MSQQEELFADYLQIKEACARLGVSHNTLRSWGASGKLTEYRHPINNYRLYLREDIEALRHKLLRPLPRKLGNKHEQ